MSIVDDRPEAIQRYKTQRGCEICGRVCPDTAITIYREPRRRADAAASA